LNLTGVDALRGHLPELNSAAGQARMTLMAVLVFALTTAYFLVTDQIPTWAIDSQIVVVALGFLIASLFYSRKKLYLQKYGALAYRNAFFRFVIPGHMILFAAVVHVAYINGPRLPSGWWSLPMLVLGCWFLAVGLTLWFRAVIAFGADHLAMLYVYYPEQSRLVDTAIYAVLRHPTYAATLRIVAGLALLNGTAFALTFALLMPLGLTGWIRLVEERELIERLGQSYVEYRRGVPAFWPRPASLRKFFQFLLVGK